jgi:phosphotriesterase-related protein
MLPLIRHFVPEPDPEYHYTLAGDGAYIEFDNIGQQDTDHNRLCDALETLLMKGFRERILLSHDAGWYRPGSPRGVAEGGLRGYTTLVTKFILMLRKKGLDKATIKLLTEENLKRALCLQTKQNTLFR